MQNNPKKRSYSEALASPSVSDQAQNFNNQSQNKNLNYDQVLNHDSQGLPPYRQIANPVIQEQFTVLGAIKWVQSLARNQIRIEEQQKNLAYNQMRIEEQQQKFLITTSAPMSQRPSSSSFNSNLTPLINSNKSK
jgi:hypothetical protein